MLGMESQAIETISATPNVVGVKAPMFSFLRLKGIDPALGVEMASTGEVGCISSEFEKALLLAMESTGIKVPRKGILMSAGAIGEKMKLLRVLTILKRLEVPIYATSGTHLFLSKNGVIAKTIKWPDESGENALTAIYDKKVDLVINIPKNEEVAELTNGANIRRAAIDYGCSLITDMDQATAFLSAVGRYPDLIARCTPEALNASREEGTLKKSARG
jgi:carbamoyl-phosphate synthase large subunit